MSVKEFVALVKEFRELEKLSSTPDTEKRKTEIEEKIEKEYYGEEYNV